MSQVCSLHILGHLRVQSRVLAGVPVECSMACCAPPELLCLNAQAMEQRYTALADKQGRLAVDNERLTSENERLAEVSTAGNTAQCMPELAALPGILASTV